MAADYLFSYLERHGVKHVFTLPGGAMFGLNNGLSRSTLKVVVVRQEISAGHMADGYARLTGRPGIVLLTSGPGALGVLSALVTAQVDSAPVFCITGNVAINYRGTSAFQEAEIVQPAKGLLKASYRLDRVSQLPLILEECWRALTTGRPGTVLLDIPRDLQESPLSEPLRLSLFPTSFTLYQENGLLRALTLSQRPLVVVGQGVRLAKAETELHRFFKSSNLPFVETLLALGHPGSIGMIGTHGNYSANMAFTHADLIIVLGARLDERATGGFPINTPMYRVDLFDIERPTHFIQLDLQDFLFQFQPELEININWLSQIQQWETEHPRAQGLSPLFTSLDQINYERGYHDRIVTTDVGSHQIWAAHGFLPQGRWITSGGFGAMGFGLTAAIGAQLADPKRLVLAIIGDGGFPMTMQELAVVKNESLPIKILIINNQSYGMIRQVLRSKNYSDKVSELTSRYGDISIFQGQAISYDIPYFHSTSDESLLSNWQACLDINQPVILEHEISSDLYLWPQLRNDAKSLADLYYE